MSPSPRIPALSRRGFLQLGAMLGGTAALAACGGPSLSTAGGAAQSDVDWSGVQPASHITWWSNHPGSSIAVEQEFVRRFQEQNPGITVELVTAGARTTTRSPSASRPRAARTTCPTSWAPATSGGSAT